MSSVDLVLLLPIAFGAWRGYQKGLFLEITSLAALFIGILMALKLQSWGMQVILPHLPAVLSGVAPLVVFIMLVVAVMTGVHTLGKMLKKVISATPLGIADSLAGAATGAVKWFFGLSIIVWSLQVAGISVSASTLSKSTVYPVLVSASPMAWRVVGIFMPFAKSLFAEVKTTLQ